MLCRLFKNLNSNFSETKLTEPAENASFRLHSREKMFDLTLTLKRRIEILGLVLAKPGLYAVADMEILFDCSPATIKRDLQALRQEGIDIHSVSKTGLEVRNSIDASTLKKLLEIYSLISQMEVSQNRAAAFLVNGKKERAVALFVTLQRCIENNIQAEITYCKSTLGDAKKRVIEPLLLFEKDNDWRLYAFDKGVQKQFLLEKISSITPLDTKFTPTDTSFRNFIKNSFGPWVGKPEIKVQLKFTRAWLANGKEPHLMDGQEVEMQKDGSKIVSFMVSSLEDVARWVVGRGGEVIALKPVKLVELVKRISKESFEGH